MTEHSVNSSVMPRLEHFTCAQCQQMVFDNSHSVRWYDVDFCSLKCFRVYFQCMFRVCATCQNAFSDAKIQIYHSAHSIFAFCDANCMETYRYLNVPCSFCYVQCSKNGRSARTIGKKKYCSLHCIKASGRIIGMKFTGGQCYMCSKKRGTTYQVKTEQENLWSICSNDCLKLFELHAKVKLGTCPVCHIKFDGASYDAAELLEFTGERRIFCSKVCLSHLLKNDAKEKACIECGGLFRYYEMIRTLATEEAEKTWCSLECADQHASALAPTRLTNAPHIELFNRDLREVNLGVDRPKCSVDEIITKDRIVRTIKVEAKVESRTKYKIPIKSKEQVDISLEERRESFRLKCSECVRQIKANEPVLRWQTMNFCSQNCLFDHMLEMHDNGLKCAKCGASSRIDILGDVMCRIGKEMLFFCGGDCKAEFVRDLHLCEFCLERMANDADEDKRFCSERCVADYEKLYAVEKVPITGECTDCETYTTLPIQLLYEGKIYGFCSFRCFFFLKFSCGIYADQCEMCEKYFERNSNELFNVRHNDLAFIFCSQICASHFILKHLVMNICAFCGQKRNNFDMIQVVDGHGKNRMLCSIKCLCYNNKKPSLVVNEEGDADTPNDIVSNATPFHVDKMISCQPSMETRATQSTTVESRHARTQTDGWSAKGIIPIPVPIYVPQPCFVPAPYPSPMPFVLPIVVPIILALSNLLGQFTGKKHKDGNIATTVGRISDVTSNIFATPLRLTSSAPEASEQASVQTSYYESCNDDRTNVSLHFQTSTPIGSVAGEFLCDIEPVPAVSDSVCETRRLKPDAILDAEDLKTEDEANEEPNFSQQTANLDVAKRIKRSFSYVDSEDMASGCNDAKKPKESLSMTTISQNGEI